MAFSQVIALSGGVGGAKLALGLTQQLAPEQLDIIVNTADDFEHLGLSISPDLDTLMYTLAGIANQQQGWGIEGESWQCMTMLEQLNGETWFRLGDRDLATHLRRTQLLVNGAGLTEVTQLLFQQLGVKHGVWPMTDSPVRTFVQTVQADDQVSELAFQRYFVEQQCQPEITGFDFKGLEQAGLHAGLETRIQKADLLVICPSNPFVSIAPILGVEPLYQALLKQSVPRVLVSPIVGDMALKGPAAKMMQELQMPSTALAVAEFYQQHYPGFVTHFVIDSCDQHYQSAIEDLGVSVMVGNTIMRTLHDKSALAKTILTATF